MTAQVIDWTSAMTNKRQTASQAAKTCEQLSMELSAYFDGELDGQERAAVELHLSECEICSAKLDQMKKLRRAMTGLSATMPRGGSVLDMLKAELRAKQPEKSAGKRRTS
jgi:anti-sigma factor RsiW